MNGFHHNVSVGGSVWNGHHGRKQTMVEDFLGVLDTRYVFKFLGFISVFLIFYWVWLIYRAMKKLVVIFF